MANSFNKEQTKPEFEALADLAEDLVYRLPGCDDVMVRKTLQNVYRDFARQSCVFKTVRRAHIVGHESCFGPTISDMYVDSVVDVRIGNRKLVYGHEYEIVGNSKIVFRGLPNFDVGCGDEGLRFIVDGAELPPHFKKEVVPDVEITCVEVPKNGSESVPSWFFDKYSEAIVSGVLFRLMSMTNKPWSDPAQAMIEKVTYESAMNEARARYAGGSQFGSGDVGSAVDTKSLI